MEVLSQIIYATIPASAWIALLLSAFLLIISGYMSSSEVAFFSLSPSDIESIKEEEHPADTTLLELLKDSERLLATILIGNNLVNVAIVILTGYAFGRIFDFSASPILGFIIQTVILTLLLLLFGEIIPKVYAQAHPLAFSRFSSGKMRLLTRLFYPLSSFLLSSTSILTRRMQPKRYGLSVDDLSQAVDLLEGHEAEQKERFEDIISFREALFIPENKPLDDLLEEFRSTKRHIAVVVDEYGGTSGIVTMEDLLEEIVGEITDEYDEEELPYKRLADGSYLFEGGTPLTDVLRALELEPGIFGKAEDEVDTLGGLVLELKRDLPRKGDLVITGGWSFKVTALEKFRITEVQVIPPPQEIPVH